MPTKEIIIDIMNETAEIKLETKGFIGKKCIEESQFLKDALGDEIEQVLTPVFYQKDKEIKRIFHPLCG